jgi:hypothetical protein
MNVKEKIREQKFSEKHFLKIEKRNRLKKKRN